MEQPKIKVPEIKTSGRKTKTGALIGGTGTGKSYKGKEIIKKTGGRFLVITYNGSGNTWDHVKEIPPTEKALKNFTGVAKIIWIKYKNDETPLLLSVYNYYRNGGLFFDDCKQYMKPNIDHTPHLIDICVEHRFLGFDMYFAAHNPLQIPRDVWTYIKAAWIFKCYRSYTENDLNCENPHKVVAAQKEINKKFDFAEKNKLPTWGIYKYAKL